MQADTGLSGLSALVAGGTSTVLQDNFVDTNGTTLTAHVMNVGPGWTVPQGTWVINSNLADASVIGASAPTGAWAVAQANQANVTISANVVPQSSTDNCGLVVRYSALTDLWEIEVNTGSSSNFTIQQRSSGSWTQRAAGSVTINAGTSYAVQAIASGQNISATINGGNQISYGSATANQTATQHGIVAGTANTETFGSFLVTSP
jgi:hypothetical protein